MKAGSGFKVRSRITFALGNRRVPSEARSSRGRSLRTQLAQSFGGTVCTVQSGNMEARAVGGRAARPLGRRACDVDWRGQGRREATFVARGGLRPCRLSRVVTTGLMCM